MCVCVDVHLLLCCVYAHAQMHTQSEPVLGTEMAFRSCNYSSMINRNIADSKKELDKTAALITNKINFHIAALFLLSLFLQVKYFSFLFAWLLHEWDIVNIYIYMCVYVYLPSCDEK